MKKLIIILLIMGELWCVNAQPSLPPITGDWVFHDSIVSFSDTLPLNKASRTTNIRAMGAGYSIVANGYSYNGMLDNPALLSRRYHEISPFALQVSLGAHFTKAIDFLVSNKSELKDGQFLIDISRSFARYHRYLDADEQSEREMALKEVNKGLEFSREVVDTLFGTTKAKRYGVGFMPKVQFQWENFGFSYSSEVQGTFLAAAGKTIEQLSSIYLESDNLGYMTEENVNEIYAAQINTFHENGELRGDALPKMMGVTISEQRYTFGYAHDFSKVFSLGINLHLIDRRFGVTFEEIGVYDPNNVNTALNTIFGNESSWSCNYDIGALFRVEKQRLNFGISLQDAVPQSGTRNTYNLHRTYVEISPMLDPNTGDPLIGYYDPLGDSLVIDPDNPLSDTIMNIDDYPGISILPVELISPPNLSIGMSWQALGNKLYLMFDIHDLLLQDTYGYEDFFDRISLGVEYWPWRVLCLRTGLATKRPTGGASVVAAIKRVDTALDFAIAYDAFTSDMTWLFQLAVHVKLGSKDTWKTKRK